MIIPKAAETRKLCSYKLELNGNLWYNTLGKSEPYETLCVMPPSITLLDVPTARFVSKGGWAFLIRAPQLGNSSPEDLQSADTVTAEHL